MLKNKLMIILGACTLLFASSNYKRSDWGRWIDTDRDCQDTRQEVLISESLIPVTMDSRKCKVTKGRWFCPYTGQFITDPSILDIDHLVPLKHAHEHGGSEWSREKKREYSNYLKDPRNLIAVHRSANRQKGAKAPHEWMPKFKPYWCSYLSDWIIVKYKFKMFLSNEEMLFIEKTLVNENCQ